MAEGSRRLGAAEAYYQLLERLWPVNVQCAVEIAADRDAVAAAWAAAIERMPVLGARIRYVDRGAEIVFGGPGEPEPWGDFATVEDAMAGQAMEPLDTERAVARCALVAGDGVTTAVLGIHHSVIDGRGVAQVALVLGALAVGEEPPEVPLLQETVGFDVLLADRLDAKARRRELLGIARELRSEPAYVDNADVVSWHDASPEGPRDLRSVLFRLPADRTARLLDSARAAGATVHGMLVAATLHACTAHSTGIARLGLSTAVDLRVASGLPPEAPVGQAAALIAASYDVTGADLDLARAVSADIRRRVARGEGELMFTLSGAERMPIGPESDDVVRRWTTAVQPTVQVSNLGVIPGPVPSAVRAVHVALAPTPNQAVFLVVTTINGSMDVVVGFDRNRVSIDGAELAAEIEQRILAMTDPA